MLKWLRIALVSASVGVFTIFLSFLFFRKFCCRRKHPNDHLPIDHVIQERSQSLQIGISKLHLNENILENKKPIFLVDHQRGISRNKPLFNWSDHPSLVTDAVENGWSRFGFTAHVASSASVRSAGGLFSSCGVSDQGIKVNGVEVRWEICQGSPDFVQIIRLHNHGLKRTINLNNDHFGGVSVVKTALPLPGPTLAYSSFPQEAYFEITILSPSYYDVGNEELIGKLKEDKVEGDKTKLIKDDYNARMSNSESLVHVLKSDNHGYGMKGIDEMKHVGKNNEGVVLSVGLARGGNLPMRLPGSHPGSIGFNSNGSVFLDGIKLVLESKTQEWGKPNMVIGCGYNPIKKNVFFTVDSQLVHEVHCKSEAFSTPLYPTLAANSDTTFLVNLGQCIFKYAPANLQRTPNPCFVGSLQNSPSLGFDSKELFSMGRLDPQWLNSNTTRSTASNGAISEGLDYYGEESESELFEITLDGFVKSPYRHQ
ncbi:hypothetical protein LIER_42943 [Lithospermum erythrorhizon]|uniref:SPRY domain-containing protein n=1 Tax=Lithospermum erythrorhizon TaxID=34254 RepID=A0AAV3PB50_LITER